MVVKALPEPVSASAEIIRSGSFMDMPLRVWSIDSAENWHPPAQVGFSGLSGETI
ncbi:hypothetical protein [Microbulbifer aestuariivivens]|uniref:hypothetical protein n=1 Tax=Microbulbifer aestuariivivens TaxID=1908308 RepID=UPI0031EE940F